MLKHKILIATLAGLLPVAAIASSQNNLPQSTNKAHQNVVGTHNIQSNSTTLASRTQRRIGGASTKQKTNKKPTDLRGTLGAFTTEKPEKISR